MPTRERRAKQLGVSIDQLPDGRGKHGNHAKGNEHYRWNEGTMLSPDGYVKIRVGKGHPLADSNGYAYEHTLVWFSAGDTLAPDEVLHHLNGDKQDNRWENLQRMTKAEHNHLHLPLRNKENGQFVGKKAAGRLLDGRKWNEMPSAARQEPGP